VDAKLTAKQEVNGLPDKDYSSIRDNDGETVDFGVIADGSHIDALSKKYKTVEVEESAPEDPPSTESAGLRGKMKAFGRRKGKNKDEPKPAEAALPDEDEDEASIEVLVEDEREVSAGAQEEESNSFSVSFDNLAGLIEQFENAVPDELIADEKEAAATEPPAAEETAAEAPAPEAQAEEIPAPEEIVSEAATAEAPAATETAAEETNAEVPAVAETAAEEAPAEERPSEQTPVEESVHNRPEPTDSPAGETTGKTSAEDPSPGPRIVYQAPEGGNPGIGSLSFRTQPPVQPYTYSPPPEPPARKKPAPENKDDSQSTMRVIFEAPEEDFADIPAEEFVPEPEPEPLFLVPNEEEPADSGLKDLFDDLPAENAVPKEKALKRFLKAFLPWKGDGPGEIVRKTVLLVSLATIIVSGWILLDVYVVAPYQSQQQSQKAVDMKKDSSKLKDWSAVKGRYDDVKFPQGMQLKYAGLFVSNNDFAGWLQIPGASINLPVVQCGDNTAYLKKDFYLNKTKYGCPFVDYRNNLREPDRNTILYGHNMKSDDLLFGRLEKYKRIEGFRESPVVQFNTLFADYQWKVYAVFITNGSPAGDNGYFFNYVFTRLSNEGFGAYIREIDSRKLYSTGVDILPTDRILTLSTCCYDFEDARLVVVARMTRAGENRDVDTSKATVNKNPRYPQAWYSKKGVDNPYKNAFKWYAG